MLDEVLAGFAAGRLTPLPTPVFPIADAVIAFRFMAHAKHIGKLVLSLPDTPKDGRRPPQPLPPRHDAPLEPAPETAHASLRADLRQEVVNQVTRVLGLDLAQTVEGQRSLLGFRPEAWWRSRWLDN